MKQIYNRFITVTEASTGYEIRINTNFIVAYRPTDFGYTKQREDLGYSVITMKSSIDKDTAPLYVMERCEVLDDLLKTKFMIEGSEI